MLGIWNAPFWNDVPSGPPISLATTLGLGYPGALAVSLGVMGLIVTVTYVVSRRRRPPAVEQAPAARGVSRVIRGAWPLWVGAVLLAALNAAALFVSGAAWGVTSAFGLWGSKVLGGLGVDVASWPYWTSPANQASLAGLVFADRVSVLDFGLIVGALIASALDGAFVLHQRIPGRIVLAGLPSSARSPGWRCARCSASPTLNRATPAADRRRTCHRSGVPSSWRAEG